MSCFLTSTVQMRHLVSRITSRRETAESLPYIGLEDIESHTGRLTNNRNCPDELKPIARVNDAEPRSGTGFCAGDVLFGTLRPYLGKAWVAEFDGVCTTEALVLRPHSIEPRFLRSIILSQPMLDSISASTVGSKMPRADWEFIGSQHVQLPSLDHQYGVADFIDGEVTEIYSLVREHDQFLKLLDEKRRALIANAVLRGLDPDVTLRDSGTAWIGYIPAHWKLEKARWLFRERDERSISGEEELLTVSHLTGVTPRSEKNVYMFEAETTEGYKVCHEDDLVVNTLWAWMGAMGIASVDGIVSPAYHVYEIGDELEPSYVDLLARLPIFSQEAKRHSKGVWSSRLRLYPEGLFDVTFPVPPIEEQQQVVAAVVTQTDALNQLVEEVRNAILLLSERRSSLISAAVTGRIEVEKAA